MNSYFKHFLFDTPQKRVPHSGVFSEATPLTPPRIMPAQGSIQFFPFSPGVKLNNENFHNGQSKGEPRKVFSLQPMATSSSGASTSIIGGPSVGSKLGTGFSPVRPFATPTANKNVYAVDNEERQVLLQYKPQIRPPPHMIQREEGPSSQMGLTATGGPPNTGHVSALPSWSESVELKPNIKLPQKKQENKVIPKTKRTKRKPLVKKKPVTKKKKKKKTKRRKRRPRRKKKKVNKRRKKRKSNSDDEDEDEDDDESTSCSSEEEEEEEEEENESSEAEQQQENKENPNSLKNRYSNTIGRRYVLRHIIPPKKLLTSPKFMQVRLSDAKKRRSKQRGYRYEEDEDFVVNGVHQQSNSSIEKKKKKKNPEKEQVLFDDLQKPPPLHQPKKNDLGRSSMRIQMMKIKNEELMKKKPVVLPPPRILPSLPKSLLNPQNENKVISKPSLSSTTTFLLNQQQPIYIRPPSSVRTNPYINSPLNINPHLQQQSNTHMKQLSTSARILQSPPPPKSVFKKQLRRKRKQQERQKQQQRIQREKMRNLKSEVVSSSLSQAMKRRIKLHESNKAKSRKAISSSSSSTSTSTRSVHIQKGHPMMIIDETKKKSLSSSSLYQPTNESTSEEEEDLDNNNNNNRRKRKKRVSSTLTSTFTLRQKQSQSKPKRKTGGGGRMRKSTMGTKQKLPRKKILELAQKVDITESGLRAKFHMSSGMKFQRGTLPKKTLNVLKDWFVSHRYKPYPTGKEKNQLISETGLSKTQIEDWFTNKRKRIWKPFLEDLLKEEGIEY